MANWRSNLETLHILAILMGFLGFQLQPLRSPVYAINSSRKPLSGGIKTSRRDVPFYLQTPRKSLLIFVVPKRRKSPILDPQKCTVSLRERQFATLPLFYAYTGDGGGGPESAQKTFEKCLPAGTGTNI